MPISTIHQLNSEIKDQADAIAVLHANTAQRQEERTAALLAGDMAGVDQAEAAITENQRKSSRLQERIQLLEPKREALQLAEDRQEAAKLRTKALAAQNIGLALHERYTALAMEMAGVLRDLTTAETFIGRTNGKIREHVEPVKTANELIRYTAATVQEEVDSWWAYPSQKPARCSEVLRSPNGKAIPRKPEPRSTGEQDADGRWLREAPELQQRTVQVYGAAVGNPYTVAELATIPAVAVDAGAHWDKEAVTIAEDQCEERIDAVLKQHKGALGKLRDKLLSA